MKKYLFKEDKLPPKLFVAFSSKIRDQISEIDSYNHNNTEGLLQWYEYINVILDYMSNPVIAWDYLNRYKRGRRGSRFVSDLGFNIRYTILSNRNTSEPFVYIFMIDFKLDEYGLKDPSSLNENKRIISLTESHIRKMVRETLRRCLQL